MLVWHSPLFHKKEDRKPRRPTVLEIYSMLMAIQPGLRRHTSRRLPPPAPKTKLCKNPIHSLFYPSINWINMIKHPIPAGITHCQGLFLLPSVQASAYEFRHSLDTERFHGEFANAEFPGFFFVDHIIESRTQNDGNVRSHFENFAG